MSEQRSDTLIPGAPADSLVGLGGNDGFVGQVERGMCSTVPAPRPPPTMPEELPVTASFPPIPIPNLDDLPPMPLRAKLLRPWLAAAGGALAITLAAMAGGGDDDAPEATTALAAGPQQEQEERAVPLQAFGAQARSVADEVVIEANARAKAQHDERAREKAEDEARQKAEEEAQKHAEEAAEREAELAAAEEAASRAASLRAARRAKAKASKRAKRARRARKATRTKRAPKRPRKPRKRGGANPFSGAR